MRSAKSTSFEMSSASIGHQNNNINLLFSISIFSSEIAFDKFKLYKYEFYE